MYFVLAVETNDSHESSSVSEFCGSHDLECACGSSLDFMVCNLLNVASLSIQLHHKTSSQCPLE